ncbi:MAG: DUF4339 domain-containing protein [Bauldia sp.]|nr:DUF4339 domain-containing protein [Bauldia sp.]
MLGQRVAIAALALAALTGGAAAQNWDLEPTFGRAILPDGAMPHIVDMIAGGPIDISRSIDPGCAGFVADAPDYRIQYTAGGTPLTISVEAVADTTLLVNDPGATWYCADDSNGSLNPSITIDAPLSGQYDIWVGTYSSAIAEAVLIISDGSAGAPPPAVGPAPAAGGPPPLPAQPAAVEYYVAIDGQPAGPMPLAQVIAMIAAGQVDEAQLVWHTGLPDWVEAGALPELDAAFNPPAPVDDRAGPPPVVDVPQKPQPAPQPDDEEQGPVAAGMSLEEVVTIGVNWGFSDVPQETRDRVIACLLNAFAPLSAEDRQLVADYGMDPPLAEIDRLEGLHPGLTRNVEDCEDILPDVLGGGGADVATSSVSLADGRTLTVVGGSSHAISATDSGYRIIVDETRIQYENGAVSVDGRPREVPPFTTELVFTVDDLGVTITADP